MPNFQDDIAIISGTPAVPTILDVICRTTGMGFAAVARVTGDRWIACSVLDQIQFGLKPGDELVVNTTICDEIRLKHQPVVIANVDEDPHYCQHDTPRLYKFKSYISVPIILPDGQFFGTLCAMDPQPASINKPEITGMFKLFADLIAFHYDAALKLAASEDSLNQERESSELREEFIAVLGHDLRTPLGAITTGASLLQESADPARVETIAQLIGRSAIRMSGLIDDIMDFARGRLGGGIPLYCDSVISLESLLNHVIQEARALWPDRTIQSHFNLTQEVHCDGKRLSQLFTNLLANAFTHGNPADPVTVAATTDAGHFILSVSNTSDPIPPEVLKRLFQPFYRADRGNRGQGLGLGLYIASEIAKAHGGALEVKSTVDQTSFTFTMPAATPNPTPVISAQSAAIGTSSARGPDL